MEASLRPCALSSPFWPITHINKQIKRLTVLFSTPRTRFNLSIIMLAMTLKLHTHTHTPTPTQTNTSPHAVVFNAPHTLYPFHYPVSDVIKTPHTHTHTHTRTHTHALSS